DNRIAGNSIGTDRSGSGSLGNGLAVAIAGGSGNVVGGTEASAGNTIAHSTEDGVEVSNFPGIPSTANRVLGNSIFENSRLGINLVVDSDPSSRVTANDADDGDGDPNQLQNFPDLLSARLKETFEVRYSVDSTPANAAYPLRVEFFLADVDGQEGRTFLGFDEYTEAEAQSTSKAAFIPTVMPAAGDLILATATDSNGNTSEFSTSNAVVEDLRVDLAVTMSESVDPVPAGSGDDNLVFTVSVVNNGPTTATGVELLDTLLLPVGVLEELVAGAGTTVSTGGTDGEWIWTVGTLAPGAGATLTVRLTVGASAVPGTDVISNTATVSHVDQSDIDSSNDSAIETTSIVESVDLKVSITESMDPALPFTGPGGFEYSVTVTNLGPATASGVAVRPTLTLPQGVTLHAITPDRGAFTDPDWSIGTLLPGVVATLTVALTLDGTVQDGTDTLAIEAAISAVDQHDNDSSNDTASEATSIQAVDCFEVTTTADSGPGSLRQAIECANEDPSADTITFEIRGAGPHVISPSAALPTLTSPIVIDGTSQAGNEEVCDALTLPSFSHQIVIDGGGQLFSGLTLAAGSDGSGVAGLNIRNFGGSGVDILDSENHSIRCNFIGTNEDGTAALGNGEHGISLLSGSTLTDVELNLISGNGIDGVRLSGTGTDVNQIHDNSIGTDQSGTGALGNGGRGLQIINGASDNTVSDNLISANVANGVRLANLTTRGNLIESNRIGTDASGSVALGNNSHSISLQSLAELNTIRGNTIAAGSNNGVRIDGSSGALVEENWIGTDSSGSSGLGNNASGVLLENDSANNRLRRNTIAFNAQDGIRVLDDGTIGNSFEENRIFSNTQSGIDLSNDGATANDPDDADLGPNALQNFPQLSRAWLTAPGQLLVTYLVDSSTSNASYPLRVEFFLSDGDGEEGMDFVGAVTYDAGNAQTEVTTISSPAVAVESGDLVVATATDDLGNTSEFSTPLAVIRATDLGVSITESTDPVIAGSGPGNLVYTATVTNHGAHDATGVVLTSSLTLPAGVTLESSVPSAGSITDSTWTLGDLASGATATLTFTMTVDGTASGGTDVIAGSLALSALDQADTVSSNDMAGEPTSVVDLSTCLAVTTVDDSGIGSLRQAIECANAVAGLDAITFAIPGAGPHVIAPSSALPEITDPVLLDGASQPGNEEVCTVAIPDRSSYQIVLDGLEAEFSGLVVTTGSDGSTIQGLNIRGFVGLRISPGIPLGGGIWIDDSRGQTVRCNFIGTDESGMVAMTNSTGIYVSDGADHTLGGLQPEDGNLISGNVFDELGIGIVLRTDTEGNRIQGNFIGTDRTGQGDLGNVHGLFLSETTANTVGGPDSGAGNLLSGNGETAIFLGFRAKENLVQGNRIGTDLEGTSALGNVQIGVLVEGASNNEIGGLEPGEGNVIAFQGEDGIFMPSSLFTTGNRIEGNSIFDNAALGIDLNGDGVTA
ncbi:MAG: right-handed parallel beta-helix repeat-containing protein, partial [Holophagales bacterium]|nr:right-handed parallel beta-helix repeat-containing protein [Holophagales bacterium]